MQQTAVKERVVPAQVITLLVSLLVALGIAPGMGAQQAWADEPITVGLAAGTNQGSGKTSFEVTEEGRSATLYAKVQNFKLGDSALVSDGWDAYYSSYGSGYTEADCANFKVSWYEGSVADGNLLEVDSLEWNSYSSKPKWGTDFTCTPESLRTAADGTYKFYAVATVSKEGYETASSDPLEFTVTVNRGTTTQDPEQYAVTSIADPADGGSIAILDNVMGSSLTEAKENTSVAVDITPAANRSIDSVQVLNGSNEDVSNDVGLYDNSNNYYGSGSEYVFTMPAYAVTVKVTFKSTEVLPSEDPKLTLVVEPAAAANLVQLWDGDDQITLVDGKASVAAGKEIEVAFQTYGTNYEPESVDVTGASINTYGGTGYYFNMPSTDATVTVKLKSTAPVEPEKTKVAVPTAKTGLEYTGSEQEGVAQSEGFTLTGNKATDAGSYTATATLADGYAWADVEGDAAGQPKSIEWSIAKKEIAAPVAETGLVAKGFELVGVKEGEGYTLSGHKATDAGEYTATATADANHVFAGGKESVEVKWSIQKAAESGDSGNTGNNTDPKQNDPSSSGSDTGSGKNSGTGSNTNTNTGSNSTTKTTLVADGAATAGASANAAASSKGSSSKGTSAAAAKTTKTKKAKKANTMTVKAKTATVKASKLKKKAQTLKVGKVLTVKKAKGKVAYTKKSGNKKIVIDKKTGKVTVKKGLKKGTYKVKVAVKAAGNASYKATTKTVTFKVKVK